MDRNVFDAKLTAVHGTSIKLVGPFSTTKNRAAFTCSEGHKWEAYPSNLIYGAKSGCRACAMAKIGDAHRMSTDAFRRLLADRKGRNVTLVSEFQTTKHRATFRCDEGHLFEAVAGQMVFGTGGCQQCSRVERSVNQVKPIWEVERDIAAIHGESIKLVGEYVGRDRRAMFECERGHIWRTSVHSVIVGKGCPGCARSGFDPTCPATLYYLRVHTDIGQLLYKIGITNLDVRKRFKAKGDFFRIVVLHQQHYDDGKEAAEAELDILRTFRALRYQGPPILRSGGNSEMFVEDVLMLDRTCIHPAFMPPSGTALSE